MKLEVMAITPDIAKEWIEKYAYHRQRTINQSRVSQYAAEMSVGQWRMGDGIVKLAHCQSNVYLISGNHRLHAVVKSGVTVDFYVVNQDFASEDDVAAEYAGTNSNYNTSMQESLRVLQVAQTIGVPDSYINSANSSLRFIGAKFGSTVVPDLLKSPATMDRLIRAWQKPVYSYWQCTMGAPDGSQRWYRVAPVMAVGLVTMRFQPETATRFWYELSNGVGLEKGSPLYSLHYKLATSGRASSVKERHDLATFTARAWNRFLSNSDLLLLKKKVDGKSFAIDGTPAFIGGMWDALGMLGVK